MCKALLTFFMQNLSRKKIEYTITVNCGNNVYVNGKANETYTVKKGDKWEAPLSFDNGYELDSVSGATIVDGFLVIDSVKDNTIVSVSAKMIPVEQVSVSYNLTNAKKSNTAPESASEGSSFSTIITANDNYYMNNWSVTGCESFNVSENKSGNYTTSITITVNNVNNNVVITAAAIKIPTAKISYNETFGVVTYENKKTEVILGETVIIKPIIKAGHELTSFNITDGITTANLTDNFDQLLNTGVEWIAVADTVVTAEYNTTVSWNNLENCTIKVDEFAPSYTGSATSDSRTEKTIIALPNDGYEFNTNVAKFVYNTDNIVVNSIIVEKTSIKANIIARENVVISIPEGSVEDKNTVTHALYNFNVTNNLTEAATFELMGTQGGYKEMVINFQTIGEKNMAFIEFENGYSTDGYTKPYLKLSPSGGSYSTVSSPASMNNPQTGSFDKINIKFFGVAKDDNISETLSNKTVCYAEVVNYNPDGSVINTHTTNQIIIDGDAIPENYMWTLDFGETVTISSTSPLTIHYVILQDE